MEHSVTPYVVGNMYFISRVGGKSNFSFFKRNPFGGFAFLTYLCNGRQGIVPSQILNKLIWLIKKDILSVVLIALAKKSEKG